MVLRHASASKNYDGEEGKKLKVVDNLICSNHPLCLENGKKNEKGEKDNRDEKSEKK